MSPWRILNEHPRAFSYLKVAIIGAILSVAVTLANNERTDQRVKQLASKITREQSARDRADARIQNAKLAHALVLANRNLALATYSIALANWNTNRTNCGLRAWAEPALKSYEQAAKDKSLSESAKKRNEGRIRDTKRLLNLYGTVPEDFKCSTLKRPVKPAK